MSFNMSSGALYRTLAGTAEKSVGWVVLSPCLLAKKNPAAIPTRIKPAPDIIRKNARMGIFI